jgi:uncharacterized protein
MIIARNVSGGVVDLIPKLANRHGLIAGATGTGKTTTLKVLAEQFSTLGVPVFLADIKGDVTGICQAGTPDDFITARAALLNIDLPVFEGMPTQFWDLFGKKGEPIRTTVSEMGPLLLSRVLELNDTQESVLTIVFKIADDQGLLLLDLVDLKSMLMYVSEHSSEFRSVYGNIASTSIGSIQRQILSLESQGGTQFFGEPALELSDFIKTTSDGRGYINLLAADTLMQTPKLYATFLLWLMTELFEKLPEVGDPDKPKLVFFFDEAHLLFNDVPKILEDKILQVVRLIRSKGVGVYFITQNPVDIPDSVLGQLSNRIQHALRAYTPKEQKAIKQASETYRTNPNIDVSRVVQELEVGEALISVLDVKGAPTIVDRYFLIPTSTKYGPADATAVQTATAQSPVHNKYTHPINRESAHEILTKRVEQESADEEDKNPSKKPLARRSDTVLEATIKSGMRTIGSTLGRELVRGILGTLFGSKRR